jgi:hypothetical protein
MSAMTDFKNIPERAALSRAVPIEFVADYRGCSVHEIRRLKRLGQMPAPLKTGGRRWRHTQEGRDVSLSTVPVVLAACFGAAGVQDQNRDSPGGARHMRNRKAAEVNADVEPRIAQIEQMTLNQIAAFQCRMLSDITTGRIAPREASAMDRALRKRLKVIEQALRRGG